MTTSDLKRHLAQCCSCSESKPHSNRGSLCIAAQDVALRQAISRPPTCQCKLSMLAVWHEPEAAVGPKVEQQTVTMTLAHQLTSPVLPQRLDVAPPIARKGCMDWAIVSETCPSRPFRWQGCEVATCLAVPQQPCHHGHQRLAPWLRGSESGDSLPRFKHSTVLTGCFKCVQYCMTDRKRSCSTISVDEP